MLRRGVFVDGTTDIGRIENVHFNPHYWGASHHPSRGTDADYKAAIGGMTKNLEAFIFGRSDWEYVTNTFVWGAKSGYLFLETKAGSCNGQFLGIGADFCQVCVRIEKIQPIGLQITNGEFTAFAGDPNTAILTDASAGGAAQFVNCNFWGPLNHVAWLRGTTAVTLSDCHICDATPAGAILAEKGKVIVRGCVFDRACPGGDFGTGRDGGDRGGEFADGRRAGAERDRDEGDCGVESDGGGAGSGAGAVKCRHPERSRRTRRACDGKGRRD